LSAYAYQSSVSLLLAEDGTGRGTPLVPDTAGALGAHRTGGWGQDIDVTGAFIPVAAPKLPARSRATALEGAGGLVAFGGGRQSGAIDVATACTTSSRIDFETETLTLAIRGRGGSQDLEFRDDGIANAVLTPDGGRGGIGVGAVAFSESHRGGCSLDAVTGALTGGGGKPGEGYPAIANALSVRRLTPRECERLQGFPDDFTLIDYRESRPRTARGIAYLATQWRCR